MEQQTTRWQTAERRGNSGARRIVGVEELPERLIAVDADTPRLAERCEPSSALVPASAEPSSTEDDGR